LHETLAALDCKCTASTTILLERCQ